jgi:hypothetical protein
MRDRTKKRNYSPEAERFRQEHARDRDAGLRHRHALKLWRLRRERAAAAQTTPEPARTAGPPASVPGPAPAPAPASATPAQTEAVAVAGQPPSTVTDQGNDPTAKQAPRPAQAPPPRSAPAPPPRPGQAPPPPPAQAPPPRPAQTQPPRPAQTPAPCSLTRRPDHDQDGQATEPARANTGEALAHHPSAVPQPVASRVREHYTCGNSSPGAPFALEQIGCGISKRATAIPDPITPAAYVSMPWRATGSPAKYCRAPRRTGRSPPLQWHSAIRLAPCTGRRSAGGRPSHGGP